MSLYNKPQLNVNKKDITGTFDKKHIKTHCFDIIFEFSSYFFTYICILTAFYNYTFIRNA